MDRLPQEYHSSMFEMIRVFLDTAIILQEYFRYAPCVKARVQLLFSISVIVPSTIGSVASATLVS
jgi:hypothetical protein